MSTATHPRQRTRNDWFDHANRHPIQAAGDPGVPFDALARALDVARTRGPRTQRGAVTAAARNPALKLMLAADTLPQDWIWTLPQELLQHPDAPTKLLHAGIDALNHGSMDDRAILALHLLRNPNLPERGLERVRDVLRNDSRRGLPRILDTNQHRNATTRTRDPKQDLLQAFTREGYDQEAIYTAAQHAKLRDDVQATLAQSSPEYLLATRDVTPFALELAAQTLPPERLFTAVEHPRITPRAARIIRDRPDTPDMTRTLLDTTFDQNGPQLEARVERLAELGHDEFGCRDDQLLRLIARRDDTRPQVLAGLAILPERYHRLGLIGNPSTSRRTLAMLALSDDTFVRQAAHTALASRQAAYPTHLIETLRDRDDELDYPLILATLEPQHPSVLDTLTLHPHPLVRLAVADHPDTPAELLQHLARDADRRVTTLAEQRLAGQESSA